MQSQFESRNANLRQSWDAMKQTVTEKFNQASEGLAQQQQQPSTTMGMMNTNPMGGMNTTTTNNQEIGHDLNQSAMNSVRRDISSMKTHNAEGFETAGAKLDETFGSNALTEKDPRTQ
ncbi:uncharacterized protein BYT42DRAFT_559480 [Radiomyces spectabilis]|uniref:uncharacterized protein n=1 Tax=Radiomyces spectabilis TaxID=64574 RepID=UPI0022206CFD|nr:uncharacterized protein BYT42DRAFT_559480 [Radiomyces spectabilis]KAI8388253.1 hypothetical protein BYT42DRAFT_559480 [Radiomyces spectabilis]